MPSSGTHSRHPSTKSIPAAVEMPSTPPHDHEIPLTSFEARMATPQAPPRAKLKSSAFVNFRTISIPEDMARKQREKTTLRLEKHSGHDGRPVRPTGGTLFEPGVRPVETFHTGTPKLRQRRPKSLLLDQMQPEYDRPHIGEPCTTECLDHRLECGHKVFTAEPEPCATNCHIREIPDYAQPKDLDDRFVCFSCIVEHLSQRHEARVSEFKAECEELALSDGRPYEWVRQKIQLMSDGWKSQDVEEMVWLATKGRYSEALWIDPDYQELVNTGIEARSLKKSRRSSIASITSNAPTMPRSSTSTPRRGSGIFSSSPAPSVATTVSTTRTPLRQSVQSFQSLFKSRSQQSQSQTPAHELSEDEAWSIDRTPESSPAKSETAISNSKNGAVLQFAQSLRKN